jgi:thioredoxin reductase (NADPH)
MKTYDLIIIGGGPTGINCAIAAQKAGLNYLVLEKELLANSIYHFPTNMTFFSTSKLLEIGAVPFISHTDKPTRKEALEYYRRIYQSLGLNIQTYEPVLAMESTPDGHYQVQSSKSTYRTFAVVVATGFYDTPRMLNVEGEELPKVKHYYDDAHPYIGQKVLVVGARNSACQVALELWRKGAAVTMAIRGNEIYPGVKYWIKPDIINRIKEGSIKAHFHTTVEAIYPDKVCLKGPEGVFEMDNDWVLAMTGYLPNYGLLQKLGIAIQDDQSQTPEHNPESLETNLPNVYIAGVICAGRSTSKLFIENTRQHGELIINQVIKNIQETQSVMS